MEPCILIRQFECEMNLREKKQPQEYSYASSYHTKIGCQFNPKSYPAVLYGYKGFSLWEKPIKRQ
jgi:hypothetical protein